MNNDNCYISTNCERKLSSLMGNMDPQDLAFLIGSYNDDNPDSPIDRTNLQDSYLINAASTLAQYRGNYIKSLDEKIEKCSTNKGLDYIALRNSMTAEERRDSARLISDVFSVAVDSFYKRNRAKFPNKSRLDFISGFKANGKNIGGEALFFSQAKLRITAEMFKLENEYNRAVDEYESKPENERNEADELLPDSNSNIKPGVSRLFESNPELANSVYEALGFNNGIEAATMPFSPDNPEAIVYGIGLNGDLIGEILVDNTGRISSSVGQAGVELQPEYIGKGYGVQTYLSVARALAKQGKTLKSENLGKSNINDAANRVWKSLINSGYAVDRGDYYEIINLATPQQKQRALQLYSQYLDTGKQDIEGFKEFVNSSNINTSLYIEELSKTLDLYEALLDNFPALCTLSRVILRDSEGIISNYKGFVSTEVDELSWGVNDFSEIFDVETAPREHWMETSELRDPFGTITTRIKHLLGSLDLYEAVENISTGGIEYVKAIDSFGRVKKMYPREAYRQLKEMLNGMQDSKELTAFLENKAKEVSLDGCLANQVLERLNDVNAIDKEQLKTQLFVGLKKNKLLYSEVFEDKNTSKKKGLLRYKSGIVNKVVNKLYDRVKASFLFPQAIEPSKKSIITGSGVIQLSNIQALDKFLLDNNIVTSSEANLQEKESTNLFKQLENKNASTNTFYKKSIVRKQTELVEIFSYLNLFGDTKQGQLKAKQAALRLSMGGHAADLKKLFSILQSMHEYILRPEVSKNLLNNQTASDLFKKQIEGEIVGNSNIISLDSKYRELCEIVAKYSGDIVTSSRIKTKNAKGDTITMFSDVNPCYMGDKIEKLKSFVQQDDAQGFKTYIEQEFMTCSLFYNQDKGYWLNHWMEELYNSVNQRKKGYVIDPTTGNPKYMENYYVFNENSFAHMFNYDRVLGLNARQHVAFENFTSRNHFLTTMTAFQEKRQQTKGKSKYAKYPVFVLGDSQTQKQLTAPMYKISKQVGNEFCLEDAFGDVLDIELERQKLVRETNEAMDKMGLKRLAHFSNTEDQFSLLQFLNEPKWNAKFKQLGPEVNKAKFIEQIVKPYFEERIGKITDTASSSTIFGQLKQLGVLDKTASGKYIYLDQFLPSVNARREKNAQGEMVEISDGRLVEEMVKEWYWNTFYANIQQFQMFTVDTAFYKNTKDFQKRYKEMHASGTPVDVYAKDFNGNYYARSAEDISEKCLYFEDLETDAEYSNPEFMEAFLYNYADEEKVAEFLAEYGINETQAKEFGHTKEERNKALMKLLGPQNFNMYKKFKQNTLTDGQGYRTLESYRRVMGMAGLWDRTQENWYNKIQALRESAKGRNLTADEYKSLREGVNIILQPLKPFLFGVEKFQGETNLNLNIPVQHKYAETVLIPELLPANSKIRELAEYMRDNDIDVACSTQCVKVGNYGAVDALNLPENPEKNIHILSYQDYRIQTNVPQHIDANQLFGTQLRKLILSRISYGKNENLASYIDGHKVRLPGFDEPVSIESGTQLVQFYNALIVSNILQDFHKFDMATKDLNKVSEMLIQAVINNDKEPLDHVLAYSIQQDEQTLLPLIEPMLSHDAVAQIISQYKKRVNKQKMKGGSAVQVSAYGISSMTAETDEESAIDGGLKILTDPENKNFLKMEAEIPFQFNLMGQDLQFEDYCNEDGTLKMSEDGKTTKIEKEFPGILDIVAYRIPTEKHYSMLNLHIKRFSRPELGGTIKVPSLCSTLAGFDFDIDKLYFLKKEFAGTRTRKYHHEQISSNQLHKIWAKYYEKHADDLQALQTYVEASGEYTVTKKGNIVPNMPYNRYWEAVFPNRDKQETIEPYIQAYCKEHNIELDKVTYEDTYEFEEYDFNKNPNENTRAARNNLLLQIIQRRLEDPATFKSRTTPGGFENPKHAARCLGRLMNGEMSTGVNGFLNADGTVNVQKLNQLAAQDKEIQEPEYNPADPMTNIIYNQQNQIASKLIGIFANQSTNHAFCTVLKSCMIKEDSTFSFAGHQFNNFLEPPTVNGEIRDVDLYVAEFLAASVDAVKDPVLKFLNFNVLTADAGATMARLGYTTFEIGLLFQQPLIVEACDYALNQGCGLQTALAAITSKYQKSLKDELSGKTISDLTNDHENTLTDSVQNLANSIASYRKDAEKCEGNAEFMAQQFHALNLFMHINKIADDLSALVQITKFTAANSVGSTMGDFYAQMLKTDNAIDKYTLKENKKTGKQENSLTFDFVANIRNDRLPLNTNTDLLDMSDEDYLKAIIANPFAFEQCQYDQNRKACRKVEQFTGYNAPIFSRVREALPLLYSKGTPDAKTINNLHNVIIQNRLATDQSENNMFKPTGNCPYRINDKTMTNEQFFTNADVIAALFSMLSESTPSNFSTHFIPSVEVVPYEEGNDVKTMTFTTTGLNSADRDTQDEFVDYWEDMYYKTIELIDGSHVSPKVFNPHGITNGPSPLTMKDLATLLHFYFYYKQGTQYNPTASIQLCPVKMKADLPVGKTAYRQTLIDMLKSDYKDMSGINETLKSYILNNLDDYNLVYTIHHVEEMESWFKNLIENAHELKTSRGGVPKSFTIEFTNDMLQDETQKRYLSLLLYHKIIARKTVECVKPCILYKGNYYICSNESSDNLFNVLKSGFMHFEKVSAPSGIPGIISSGENGVLRETVQQTKELSEVENPVQGGSEGASIAEQQRPDEGQAADPVVEITPEISDEELWNVLKVAYRNAIVRLVPGAENDSLENFKEFFEANLHTESKRKLLVDTFLKAKRGYRIMFVINDDGTIKSFNSTNDPKASGYVLCV